MNFPVVNNKKYNKPIGHFLPSEDSKENLSIFTDKEIQTMAKFFNEGYDAFKIEDINREPLELIEKPYPTVIKRGNGIDTFDHALQPITLSNKIRWTSGWRKARKELLAKRFSIKNLKQDILQAMKKHGVTVSPKYDNSLYLMDAELQAVFKIDLG